MDSKQIIKPMKKLVQKSETPKVTIESTPLIQKMPTKKEIMARAMKDTPLRFKMWELDLIYDSMYLTSYGDVRNNGLLTDFGKVFEKIERVVIPELYENKKVRKK